MHLDGLFFFTYLSRKYRETSGELAKTKRELEEAQAKVHALQEIRDARDADAQRDAADALEIGADAVNDSELLTSVVKEESISTSGVDIKKENEDEAMVGSFISSSCFN